MLEGLYTALAGMEAQQTSTDAMANDIANLDTPGYKAQQVSFHGMPYSNGGHSPGAREDSHACPQPGKGGGNGPPQGTSAAGDHHTFAGEVVEALQGLRVHS